MEKSFSESEQINPKHPGDSKFRIVAIACSAGGLQAVSKVISALPANFPVPIVIVQHLDPKHRSMMADILSRRTKLQVKQAEQGELMNPGTIYIAPPNYHLLVTSQGSVELTQSEVIHFVRPSADVLFESVANSYESQAIAVILTGTGVDGAVGVREIKEKGGIVIVEDSETSEFDGMPKAAIKTGIVDQVLPLSEIARALITLVMGHKADGE
ncbi:chemotaxis protein CheB [Calothrix sp. PCC 6303]|uniref:chemotaxis protein CheB n=1 Tax=Calothrix sp. PCC 6303 TaxID=1170562 RepID=UPI0002A012E2|nr:chemotaxis protein CheB [Calothrix sp. PCC 6303]AFZ03240.1 CheB methylesterase [Calothrix sp. PCC 6303]